jgi:hypothetical protein
MSLSHGVRPIRSAAGVCYHTFREGALPRNPENGGLLERARHYFRTKGTKRTAPAAVVVAVPSACTIDRRGQPE